MIIFGLCDIAVPKVTSAVGTNAEFLIQRDLGSGDISRIIEVQAPIAWKLEVCNFFEFPIYICNATKLFFDFHSRPPLEQ